MLLAVLRRGLTPTIGVLAVAALTSCGSKGSVSLNVALGSPQLVVNQLALGTQLSGGFVLSLELGPEASGNTSVSLDKFSLLNEDGAELTSLDPIPQGVTFPLGVAKGESKSVNFTLDDQKLYPAALRDTICAGQVHIAGSVIDSLGGEPIPVQSPSFSASGC